MFSNVKYVIRQMEWFIPSLQDGGIFGRRLSPGFTLGYFHWLPMGARYNRKFDSTLVSPCCRVY
jgi:hypothetical protein